MKKSYLSTADNYVMPIPEAPLTLDEAEELRLILRKANKEKLPLTQEETKKLREYVARDKPDEAKTADVATLVFFGMVVLGLCISIFSITKDLPKAET